MAVCDALHARVYCLNVMWCGAICCEYMHALRVCMCVGVHACVYACHVCMGVVYVMHEVM